MRKEMSKGMALVNIDTPPPVEFWSRINNRLKEVKFKKKTTNSGTPITILQGSMVGWASFSLSWSRRRYTLTGNVWSWLADVITGWVVSTGLIAQSKDAPKISKSAAFCTMGPLKMLPHYPSETTDETGFAQLYHEAFDLHSLSNKFSIWRSSLEWSGFIMNLLVCCYPNSDLLWRILVTLPIALNLTSKGWGYSLDSQYFPNLINPT